MVHYVQILQTYVFITLSGHWYANFDEASPRIIFSGRYLLVKMLITLEPCGAFCSNFADLCIIHHLATGMQICDEASQRIIFSGRSLFVKMLITLEQHG